MSRSKCPDCGESLTMDGRCPNTHFCDWRPREENYGLDDHPADPPGSFNNPKSYTPEGFTDSFKRRVIPKTVADYANPMSCSLMPLNPRALDEKTVAERKWTAPLKPAKPQQPCDIGLFSDEMDQVEMFMDPTNDMP